MDASVPMRMAHRLLRFSRTIQTHVSNAHQSKTLRCTRCLSALTQSQTSNLRPVFKTQEDDPRNHTLGHVGLYYKLKDTDVNGILNGCIEPQHLRLMKTFNEHCLMVRQPSLELNGYLANLNLNHPVPRFVLYGRKGAGKHCTLIHTMHYCALNNWILVHVPWAGRWTRGFFGYKEVAESTHKAGRYDLPSDAVAWLTHFQTQNQGRLKELKTKNEYIWTKREKAAIGTPLVELIDFGLRRVKFASDCVGAILKELRQQAADENLKVLVVVEGVNAFFVPWTMKNCLKNLERRKLLPHEISLIHNFKKMLSPTWTHGAVVCSVIDSTNVEELRKDYTPKYLLGQEGFEWLDPFVPILVPEYSEKEALSTLDYYNDRNWIQRDYGKTEEGKKEIMFVSNKNPFNLYKVCSSL